jgi:hypothetical protein
MRSFARAATAALFVLAGVLGGVGRARADVTVEALGQVQAGGDDAEKTRTRALDDAFRQAVDQVIGTLVTPETRAASADSIKKRVLRRSKAYVVSHRVLDEGAEGAMYQVHVEAVIGDQLLRKDLRALTIPLVGDAAVSAPLPGGGAPAPPGRPKLAILVVGGAEITPLVERLTRELGTRGWEIAIAERAEVPRDDGAAFQFGAAKGARVTVVASAALHDGGAIRGTRLRGIEADLLVRIVDGTGATPARLTEQRLGAAGVGTAGDVAQAAALGSAAERVGAWLGPLLADKWPAAPRGTPTGLVVWVRHVERWQEPAAIAAAVARLPGVDRVTVAGASRGEVRFVVVGRVDPNAVASSVPGALGTTSIVARSTVQVDLAPPVITPPPAGPVSGEGVR